MSKASAAASSQVSKEAAHEYAMKLTNDVLQNREPVAAAVLVWGWILKQVSFLFLEDLTPLLLLIHYIY